MSPCIVFHWCRNDEFSLCKLNCVSIDRGSIITVTSHEHQIVWNLWQLNCFFNSMFRQATKKTLKVKLCIAGLFVRGIHPSPMDSLHKGPVMWKAFPCCNIIMWIWLSSYPICVDFCIYIYVCVQNVYAFDDDSNKETLIMHSHDSCKHWHLHHMQKHPGFILQRDCVKVVIE